MERSLTLRTHYNSGDEDDIDDEEDNNVPAFVVDNTDDNDNDDGDGDNDDDDNDDDDVDEEDNSEPALVVDHPDRKVARVDAEVERDAPHYDQPQLQPW